MFRFAHPYYFLLLLPLAAAAGLMFIRRVRQAAVFAPTRRLPVARTTWRTVLAPIFPVLFVAGTALCIVALARPQTVLEKSARQSRAIAIQMVVDVSGSMEALDFSTRDRDRTRLDVVKETFADFVGKRPDDMVGLVTFGGYATSRVPLTIDHGALLAALKGVQVPAAVLDADGRAVNEEEMLTAIGDGLATACGRLEKCDLKSRIIVLLTDGVSNTGLVKPDDAMKAAKALGVKVYTIGVGTSGQVPMRMRDLFGRAVKGLVEVAIDEDLLRKIAETTGGQYFNVRDPKGMEKALREIDKLEKTKIEKEVFNHYHELFPKTLWPGLALVLLAATGGMLAARRLA